MIAKLPTIAAMAYKYHIGQPFVYPKNDLSYAANFLHMCFAVPCEEYKVNPILARAMDRIFILHADHEQNASTSTVRLAGSSGANPFACIAAGIACLWGPAHGGANEAALKMLGEIGDAGKIPAFIAKVKDKNAHIRLMGFGHRVYKNYDPRAKIMQKTAHEVLGELGIKDDPLLDVARELERVALNDSYFIERKLYPNVDFYSGIILRALGFPTIDVHRALRSGPHGRLDRPVEGDDRGSLAAHRPAAPALYRIAAARLCSDEQAREVISCSALVHQHGADLGFGHLLAVDHGFGRIVPDGRPLVGQLDLEVHGVAGHHRFAEARLVDRHEEDEFAGMLIAQMVRGPGRPPSAPWLRSASTPGMTGLPGKWPWKNGSLMVTFLIAGSRLLAIHIDQLVDEQERIAMRQKLHDARDVRARRAL